MNYTEAAAYVVKDQRWNSGLDEFATATDAEILAHVRNVIDPDEVVVYTDDDGSISENTLAYWIVTAAFVADGEDEIDAESEFRRVTIAASGAQTFESAVEPLFDLAATHQFAAFVYDSDPDAAYYDSAIGLVLSISFTPGTFDEVEKLLAAAELLSPKVA